MSAKNLEVEFNSLKNEFDLLKSKIDSLVSKYSNLEKKYEQSQSRKKKAMFKCRICDEELENVSALKEHKEEHNSCQGEHQCEECEKRFKKEEQLEAHKKTVHKKYECDECEKIFDFEGNLEKHRQAAHEDVELFCHYFNNDKDCPYEEECIFVHEESEICKFGKSCERKMCMYRHENIDDESENEEEESSDEEASEKLKPSLEKVQKSIDKVTALLAQVCPDFKCQQCDFEAKNVNGLNMHVKAKHTNKS